MLCVIALENYEKFGKYPSANHAVEGRGQQRGLLINYDSLPGYVPRVLLPHFSVNPVPEYWLDQIAAEAAFYSKGRKMERKFHGDSEDKESRSTSEIRKYASSILNASYVKLNELAFESLKGFHPRKYQLCSGDWSNLKPLVQGAE